MGENALIARRWFEQVWVAGGESAVDQLLAPDATGWLDGRTVRSATDFKDLRRTLLRVFPDLTITVEDTIEQDDRIAVRWHATATHRGDGLGVPPTNRRVTFRGISWLELRDGRIVRGWETWSLGALLQALRVPAGREPFGPESVRIP